MIIEIQQEAGNRFSRYFKVTRLKVDSQSIKFSGDDEYEVFGYRWIKAHAEWSATPKRYVFKNYTVREG